MEAPPSAGPFAGSAPGHYGAVLGYQATLDEAALGQFGILAPTPVPEVGAEGVFAQAGQEVERTAGQLSSRIVVDPPELAEWRERLFNVDEMIVLTHEQFETYFPHVDNVYSHRSTQRYKRKPFVSHYWDCRMKGRPPGTPKSSDPNKKKRKRSARERDLCDVKIKITEYFPDATALSLDETAAPAVAGALGAGQRIWTIQRVNGNGGNGKGDGVAGPHKHTLEKSDEIKKNSVQRFLARHEKEERRLQKPVVRKATGRALTTARKHSKENELKLHAACFCPFSQRIWIALEAKGLAYQYCETDPHKKSAPAPLLEARPRSMVPELKHGDWTCNDSGTILEYLEDVDQKTPLLPADPRLKADCRKWIHHINTHIVPAFFALLQSASAPPLSLPSTLQSSATARLQAVLQALVQASSPAGPFFLGPSLCLVDVHLAPFALRLSRVLKPLRGWPDPEPESRWARWVEALEACEAVRGTTSAEELYVETAEVLARGEHWEGGAA